MKTLILFVDALGFSSITKERMPKLFELFTRGIFRRVRTLLGYSNTIIPSIFSGAYPVQHDIWSIYRLSPKTSPFKVPPFFPPSIFDRNLLLRYFANRLIYHASKRRGLIPSSLTAANIPIKFLKYFDVSTQKHVAEPLSVNSFPTIFDLARGTSAVTAYVGYPFHKGTEVILDLAEKKLNDSAGVVAYIDEIDHFQHKFGVNSPEFRKLLLEFDESCSRFLSKILSREDVNVIAFSDHGMKDVNGFVDLAPLI
ncbi:MAG: alkaline phosphatase family protein, partial [Nitrososphaera sp.]